MSTLDSGGSSSEKGVNPGSPGEGSFILFEDQISADIVTSRGDHLQGGPSVHSLQTGKSDSFRGTQSSDAVDSYLGWIQKVSTTELLSPIASRGQTRQETADTFTNQETSSGQQIMYIEQPEFRQRLRPEHPGFKSPSLRIGSRGRIFRRVSDPSGSIPTSQKALPLPASSAARAAPPALVNLQTHRQALTACTRRP
ncbi:hypothetical protein AK812_SmicGene38440 [Symbiodinium microadriaticum]|uniref:Uncharacterized protein n=1 Tax=Symbiodinium microadriaticum TaxID=2951 RepID=A0A1Q9CDR5_SYMMI|nr:hypothetical protein AK812_SmicGene38440 [Symbiodinium microadriaticum]